jgi:HAD-superfamily hydrolase, subfamily IIB
MLTVLDEIEFDGYITYNGACCVDSTKTNIIYKNTIPQKDISALIKRLEWDKFPVSFMCKDNMYVNYIDENVVKVAEIVGVGMPKLRDAKHAENEDVFQVCIYVKEEKLNTILSETLTSCEGSRWIEYFADVNVIGLNKQSGIDRMLDYFNIPLNQAMAFGDGGNDIPMLKHVPYGIAMGNSSDLVKSSASYVTTSVDEEGITKAIEYFKEKIILILVEFKYSYIVTKTT